MTDLAEVNEKHGYAAIIPDKLFLGPEVVAARCVEENPHLNVYALRLVGVSPEDPAYLKAFRVQEDFDKSTDGRMFHLPMNDVDDQDLHKPLSRAIPFIESIIGKQSIASDDVEGNAHPEETPSPKEKQKTDAVYVHCAAGVSRSASIVAGYLMHTNKWTVRQAIEFIAARRPVISPNAGFVKQLGEFQESFLGSKSDFGKEDQAVRDLSSICPHKSHEEILSALKKAGGKVDVAANELLSS